jgi:protein dithiol oxidoreductase (disulfide-forming)
MGSIAEASESPTYGVLQQPLKGTPPPVIVFFSFFDKISLHWATQKNVTASIRKSLPAGTDVHRYHVSLDNTGWNFGEELTRAWAVAGHLHVDDKIIGPLFEKVLVERAVSDLEGIREVFWRDGGIDKVLFDRVWNDPRVLADMRYQDELSREIPNDQLPCIVIRGQEIIKGSEVQHMCDDEHFGAKVGQLVRQLLDK